MDLSGSGCRLTAINPLDLKLDIVDLLAFRLGEIVDVVEPWDELGGVGGFQHSADRGLVNVEPVKVDSV